MTDKQLLKILGQNVRTARLAANLTQEGLAEMTGVHWQTISYLEAGKTPFAVTLLIRLTQALNVNADRLLAGIPAANQVQFAKVRKTLARKRRPKNQPAKKAVP